MGGEAAVGSETAVGLEAAVGVAGGPEAAEEGEAVVRHPAAIVVGILVVRRLVIGLAIFLVCSACFLRAELTWRMRAGKAHL